MGRLRFKCAHVGSRAIHDPLTKFQQRFPIIPKVCGDLFQLRIDAYAY
jgi:hypothetical protein